MKILVVGDFQGVFPAKLKRKLKKEDFDVVVGVGDYAGIEDWRPYFKTFFRLLKNKGEYLSAEEFFGKKKHEALLKKDYESGKRIIKEINGLGKKGVIVFGNTDWYHYPYSFQRTSIKDKNMEYDKLVRRLRNLKNINYKTCKFKGIEMLGFGGYMEGVVNLKNRGDKKKLKKRLARVKRTQIRLNKLLENMKKKDIFVLHYPPQGVFDIIKDKGNPYNGESSGVTMFRQAIKKHKPKLVLCGHMHEYQGAKRLFGSLVVNPGDAEKGKCAIVDWPSLKVKFVR